MAQEHSGGVSDFQGSYCGLRATVQGKQVRWAKWCVYKWCINEGGVWRLSVWVGSTCVHSYRVSAVCEHVGIITTRFLYVSRRHVKGLVLLRDQRRLCRGRDPVPPLEN